MRATRINQSSINRRGRTCRSPRGMQLVRADGVHRPRVVRAVARSRARGRRARARRRLRRAGGRRLGPRPTRARARQRGGRCGRVGGGGRRPARGRPRRAPRGGRRVRDALRRATARALALPADARVARDGLGDLVGASTATTTRTPRTLRTPPNAPNGKEPRTAIVAEISAREAFLGSVAYPLADAFARKCAERCAECAGGKLRYGDVWTVSRGFTRVRGNARRVVSPRLRRIRGCTRWLRPRDVRGPDRRTGDVRGPVHGRAGGRRVRGVRSLVRVLRARRAPGVVRKPGGVGRRGAAAFANARGRGRLGAFRRAGGDGSRSASRVSDARSGTRTRFA